MGGSVLRFDRDDPSQDPMPGGRGREGPTTERAAGTVRRVGLRCHCETPDRHCSDVTLGVAAGAVIHLQGRGRHDPPDRSRATRRLVVPTCPP